MSTHDPTRPSAAGPKFNPIPRDKARGRGSRNNPTGRFEARIEETFDDGWGHDPEVEDAPPLHTEVLPDASRSVIAWNDSPDLPFDRSINPYRGCEHGCIYCYARPSHAYLGLSPGLDFETRLFAKFDAADILRKELGKKGYKAGLLSLGANTDPYQPVEKTHKITRGILEVLAETRHPVGIVTKSALICRDIDILQAMAKDNLVEVWMSLTSLDSRLSRRLEPRAAGPRQRLRTIETLREADIPVNTLTAPIIPAINDMEIESLLKAAAEAGAGSAAMVLIRLPLEVAELFAAWLDRHLPERKEHILSLIRQCRDGALNDSTFRQRMTGTGAIADMIRQRFRLARKRYGLGEEREALRCDLFRPPSADQRQTELFD